MRYKEHWEDTQKRFEAWWKGTNTGRPLMKIVAKRKEPVEALETVEPHADAESFHLNVEKNIRLYRNYCRSHSFMAEAFPNFSIDLGPGSMALYLGAEPEFSWDTLWFKECIHEWDEKWRNLSFDQQNRWWVKHQEMARQARDLAGGDFPIAIPDIIENLDILLVMRGTENLCYDLMDEAGIIKEGVSQIDDLYFKYYDTLYDMLKFKDGSSVYTCFQIWGQGKTAKVQCDFSAMMSPGQYREFALESLKKQCARLDNSLYHLDGPDAIKHVDAIMEIKDLKALQWTCGAGQPDGGSQQWYPIYEKVRAAGKSLWIQFYDGGFEDWVKGAEKLVRTFGSQGMYMLFPDMEEEEAVRLINIAEERWS